MLVYAVVFGVVVPGPSGLPPVPGLCPLPQVADAGAARVRRRGVHDPCAVAGGDQGHRLAPDRADGRGADRHRRGVRDDDQSLPLLLAGGAGSRGAQRRSRRQRARARCRRTRARHLRRIKIDTYIGMGFSNLIALFIIVSCAATLHANGITDITTSAQAAEALRPLAGDAAFLLFASASSARGCWRCRCWPDPRHTRWPKPSLEERARPETARSARVLRHHRVRDAGRRVARLLADRPHQGAVLERRRSTASSPCRS